MSSSEESDTKDVEESEEEESEEEKDEDEDEESDDVVIDSDEDDEDDGEKEDSDEDDEKEESEEEEENLELASDGEDHQSSATSSDHEGYLGKEDSSSGEEIDFDDIGDTSKNIISAGSALDPTSGLFNPKAIKDKPLVEGFLTKEGSKVKNWKKRHFRIFHKKGYMNYYKDEKAGIAKGVILLRDIEVRKIVYKNKPFCFLIRSLRIKDRIFYISCPTQKVQDLWMEKIIQVTKFSEPEFDGYTFEIKELVRQRTEQIKSEFSLRKNYAKCLEKLKKLIKEYPEAIRPALLRSKLHMSKNQVRQAVNCLEKKVQPNLLPSRVAKMADEEVWLQYKLHTQIANILIETKKKENIERAIFFLLTACVLQEAKKSFPCKSTVKLGQCYMELKNYDIAKSYFKKLVDNKEFSHFTDLIKVMKILGEEEELFDTLVEACGQKKEYPAEETYRELCSIITGGMKKLKAKLTQKSEFFGFVGIYAKEIKYSEQFFEQYQQVLKLLKSKNFKKLITLLQDIIDDKAFGKSEFLAAIVHHADKKDGNKGFAECSEAICGELGDRVKFSNKDTINLLIRLEEHAKTDFVVDDIFEAIVRNVKVLQSREGLSGKVFERVVERFLDEQEKFGYAFSAFEKLDNTRCVPFLVTGVTHAKNLAFRVNCILNLPKHARKGTTSTMKKKLSGVVEHKGAKVDLKMAGAAVLYYLTGQKKWINSVFAPIKGSQISEEVLTFIKSECENGKKVASALRKKKKSKNWKI